MKKEKPKKSENRIKSKTYMCHLSCTISSFFLASQLPVQETYWNKLEEEIPLIFWKH